MNKFVALALGLLSAPLWSCDGQDIANFKVKLDSSLAVHTDVAWQNQFKMVKAMQLVPEVVELSIPRVALLGGYYPDEATFIASLGARQKTPVINLTLRLIGNWIQLLSDQSQHPEIAGSLFAWILNQVPLEMESDAEVPQMVWRGWAHRLTHLAFNPFPSLRTFETLEGRENAARAMLTQTGIFFTMLEPLSNRPRTANEVASEALGNALNLLGASFPEAIARFEWGVRWDLPFLWANGDRANVTVQTRGIARSHGFWWIPAPSGKGFGDVALPSVLDVSLGEEAVASLIPLPREFIVRERFDRHWLELLFYPLLLEAGMYETLSAAQEVVSAPSPFTLYQRIPVDRSREITDEEAKESAIAQIASSIHGLYVADREPRMNHFLFQLLEREKTLNFASLERIFRKYQVPIYLIAQEGDDCAWPDPSQFPQFASKRGRPTRYLAIYVPAMGGALAHIHSQFGLTAERNLQYLETMTGVLSQ